MPLAIEELAAQSLGESHHGLTHFFGTGLAGAGHCFVLVHVHELQSHVLRKRVFVTTFLAGHGSQDDGAADQVAVSAAHASYLIFLATRDHHDGRDQHLTEQIAFVHLVSSTFFDARIGLIARRG